MVGPSYTLVVVFLAGGALIGAAMVMAWLAYLHTRFVTPYAFAVASLMFLLVFLLNAFMRSPVGYPYVETAIIIQRTAFMMGAIMQFLAVDALAASYNGHRSLLRRLLRPAERRYLRWHEERESAT